MCNVRRPTRQGKHHWTRGERCSLDDGGQQCTGPQRQHSLAIAAVPLRWAPDQNAEDVIKAQTSTRQQ